ncbi:MAG: glycosyltransferase family 4 protein [Candidatus Dormibacteraeota bacterium]|nr:glycosyltransferase family 4 protein [Candidatus Dormibacteraeota bacterium]
MLVDGRALYNGNEFRGIGVYLRSLLAELVLMDEFELHVLAPRSVSLPAGVARVPVRRLLRNKYSPLEHEALLPGEIRRFRPDLYHSPAQEPPRRCDAPWVQTLHSVDDHPALGAVQERWRGLAERVRRAAGVMVASAHAGRGVAELLGLDAARVHVAPHGVDPIFRPPGGPRLSDPPYLLYVSEYGPHKGYPEAFEAVSRLAERGYPHELRVAGRMLPWVEPEVRALVAQAGRPDRIRLLGYVPRPDLVRQYQAATAVVLSSRCEAFGLTAVEAMATGTPLVAFANTALPEVIGGGGVMVSDGDVGAMTEALITLIDDPSASAETARRGVARAAEFTWHRSAMRHADVFRRLAG